MPESSSKKLSWSSILFSLPSFLPPSFFLARFFLSFLPFLISFFHRVIPQASSTLEVESDWRLILRELVFSEI